MGYISIFLLINGVKEKTENEGGAYLPFKILSFLCLSLFLSYLCLVYRGGEMSIPGRIVVSLKYKKPYEHISKNLLCLITDVALLGEKNVLSSLRPICHCY